MLSEGELINLAGLMVYLVCMALVSLCLHQHHSVSIALTILILEMTLNLSFKPGSQYDAHASVASQASG